MDLVSPQPFWLLKNGLIHSYPSLREDLRCDVVVLGGGISGAFMAESLTRAGLEVVVLDKRDVGSGSTSASTALLQYEIDLHLIDLTKKIGRQDAERAYRICHDSIDGIEAMVRELEVECVFQRKKSVYLGVKESDAKVLRGECAARQAMGIAVEYLEPEDIASRFSFTRPAALLSHQAGQLDAHQLAHALLKAAESRGARIYDRTCAAKIDHEEHGVRLETERGFIVRASQVVFATGYESQDYLPKKVLRLKSTFAFASEPLTSFEGWWEQCLLWETARPYLYLRTSADGRALVGGEDDPFRYPDRRDRMVDKKTDVLAEKFRTLFPGIDLALDYKWAGTFGETDDGLAYIGAVRQMPRCFFALGFGGNGITYSIVAAEIIREAIAGRTHPDAALFSFDR
jgi:glycine/D-amino acid oxidase-like deaminating enzyme